MLLRGVQRGAVANTVPGQTFFEYIIQIKAMKKIEEVTCIKFEDRAQENYHQEQIRKISKIVKIT